MASIKQLGPDRWQVRVRVKDHVTGVWGEKRKNVKGTKRDAEKAGREMETAKDQGLLQAGGTLTLAQHSARWLEAARPGIAYRTHQGYESNLRLHVLPSLGHVRLHQLTPLMIQDLCVTLQSKGLSGRSVRYVHATVRRCLGNAVKLGLLPRNPAAGVELPKLGRYEAQVLDEVEARKLIQHVSGTRLHIPIVLALTAGLRRGEIAGLTWRKVDLDRGTLEVTQSLQRQKGRGLVVSSTKSHRSQRPVALSPAVVKALREWRAQQARDRLAAGVAWAGGDWVCTHKSGTPMSPEELTKGFLRVAERLGFKGVTLHCLRHTCATLLLREKVNPRVVQERLGHSSVVLTLDTYSHLAPDLQRDAANALDQLLRP